MDLLKKEGKGRDEVEEFNVFEDDGDAPTPVSLINGEIRFGEQTEQEVEDFGGGGYSGGYDDGDSDDDGEGGDDIIPDAPEEETSFENYDGTGELTDEQYGILQQQLQDNMEPAESEYQYVYDSAAFHVMMGTPRGVMSKIARTFTVDKHDE